MRDKEKLYSINRQRPEKKGGGDLRSETFEPHMMY